MLSFEKLVDLGSVAPHVYMYVMYQNISDWLTVDYLIAYKVLLTACHICFHQKSTTLTYVPEVTVLHSLYVQINYVNPLLSLNAYFVFFELTAITVFAVYSAVTFAFVTCSNNIVHTGFRLVPKSVTLNDLAQRNNRYL